MLVRRAQAERPPRPVEPLEVIVNKRTLGACPKATNGANMNTHGAALRPLRP